MSATNRVAPFELWPDEPSEEARESAGSRLISFAPRVHALRVPELRLTPLLHPEQPRRFVRVPTHAVGVHPEQREYPRASLNLPLRLRSAGGVPEEFPVTRSEEHTSELQSRRDLVCRLLLEKKKKRE